MRPTTSGISARSGGSLRLVLTLLLAWLALGTGSALASEAAEEQRGAELLTAVERGEMDCADLESGDFDAIGEFAMGRMLGSSSAHEAMDETITRMMGEAGLGRMHEVMGQRFADCGAAGAQGGYGGMMGMLGGGMMGGPGQGYGPDDASGQGYGPGTGFGSMMGLDSGADDDDNGPGAWAAILMLLLIVGAGGAVYALTRPRRAGSPPLGLLEQRFARGELSVEDYEQRRRLLEGRGS